MKFFQNIGKSIKSKLLKRIEKKLLEADTQNLDIEVHAPKDIVIGLLPFLNGRYNGEVKNPAIDHQNYNANKELLTIFNEGEGFNCFILSKGKEIFASKEIEIQVTHNLVGKRINLTDAFPNETCLEIFKMRRKGGKMLIEYNHHFIKALENNKADSLVPKSFDQMMSDFKNMSN